MKLLIWWVCQEDCEKIGEEAPEYLHLPDYLKEEYDDRAGRPGRGRLWVNELFPRETAVDPWPNTELAQILGSDYGGIVIREEDTEKVRHLGGIVTDLKLNKVFPHQVAKLRGGLGDGIKSWA